MSEFKAKDIVVMNVPKGSFYDYNGLMEVSIAIDGEPKVFVGWHPIFKYGMVDKSVIRHATPEEIAAGYPLNDIKMEVSYGIKLNDLGVVTMGFDPGRDVTHDLGDDFPIENHISPNCKVTEAHINEADKLNRLG